MADQAAVHKPATSSKVIIAIVLFAIIATALLLIVRADAGNVVVSGDTVQPTDGNHAKCSQEDAHATAVIMFGAMGCDGFDITDTTPKHGETDVSPFTTFNLKISETLAPEVDSMFAARVTSSSSTKAIMHDPQSVVIDLPRGSLSFALEETLEANTVYSIEFTGLKSDAGVEIVTATYNFTTGEKEQGSGLTFSKAKVGDITAPTSVVISPNKNRLFISNYIGEIHRVNVDQSGSPQGNLRKMSGLPSGIAVIGMAFEPGTNNTLWISEWQTQGAADEYNSSIVRYTVDGTKLTNRKVMISGLVRHPNPRGNHGPHSLQFHNDKLYISAGSATSGGAVSPSYWGEPRLQESGSTGAILEFDYKAIANTVNNKTFNVTANSNPLRLYATGVRNAYDLVWHSNGSLYANVNQNGNTNEQNGSAPTYGQCEGLNDGVNTSLVKDILIRAQRGKYYGHPNESRGECIVLGGGQGTFAVPGYPTTQLPDPNFDELNMAFYESEDFTSFGRSANGLDEYKGSGPLKGQLLTADFAGTRGIIAVKLSPNKANRLDVESMEMLALPNGDPLTFISPLDVFSHPSSNKIYVADFGNQNKLTGGAVYLLEAQ